MKQPQSAVTTLSQIVCIPRSTAVQSISKATRLTSNKQLDSSSFSDLLLISLTLLLQVLCISIKNVSVGWINVNVLEEIVPHVGVVTLGMSTR